MIAVDSLGNVVGAADLITQDPNTGILTVWTGTDTWHAIATDDRHSILVYNQNVPDITRQWTYIEGSFTDVTVTGTQSNNQ